MKPDHRGKRVFIYARVSTVRQANNDISVPDQIDQGEQWIASREATLAGTFVEAGRSAKKDSRKVFRQMMQEAMSEAHPADLILVHSQSRLFRNALDYLKYKAKLAPHRVKIVSLTQEFGDDPASDLAMNMIAVFDEYHSAENAKHVRRTMAANARAGYWNGHRPPLGYRIVSVPQERGKDRKRLEIDGDSAHIPEFAFKTYASGTADGPIGLARLAALLNERGERIHGRLFHTSNVQALLENTAYMGVAHYNKRDSVTGTLRPKQEWIPIQVPAIIPEELFYRVQAIRASRDPKMGERAVKTKTNLLTGMVVCGCDGDGCGGGMTTATGKSGQYKYYSCHKRTNSGAGACKGRRLPMKSLDDLVIAAIKRQILKADRLQVVLARWLQQSAEVKKARREDIKQLKARLARLDEESANVIKLVRKGFVSADDPQVATELAQIAGQKKSIAADIDLLDRQVGRGRKITPEILEKFAALVSEKLNAEPAVRKAYVQLLVDRIEVGNEQIRISGLKEVLAQLAAGVAAPAVPKAIRGWRARQESNLRPQD